MQELKEREKESLREIQKEALWNRERNWLNKRERERERERWGKRERVNHFLSLSLVSSFGFAIVLISVASWWATVKQVLNLPNRFLNWDGCRRVRWSCPEEPSGSNRCGEGIPALVGHGRGLPVERPHLPRWDFCPIKLLSSDALHLAFWINFVLSSYTGCEIWTHNQLNSKGSRYHCTTTISQFFHDWINNVNVCFVGTVPAFKALTLCLFICCKFVDVSFKRVLVVDDIHWQYRLSEDLKTAIELTSLR